MAKKRKKPPVKKPAVVRKPPKLTTMKLPIVLNTDTEEFESQHKLLLSLFDKLSFADDGDWRAYGPPDTPHKDLLAALDKYDEERNFEARIKVSFDLAFPRDCIRQIIDDSDLDVSEDSFTFEEFVEAVHRKYDPTDAESVQMLLQNSAADQIMEGDKGSYVLVRVNRKGKKQ